MKYTYEIYTADHTRVHVCTRLEEAKKEWIKLNEGGYVKVWNNLREGSKPYSLKSEDDFDEFEESAARALQWSDSSEKSEWKSFEELQELSKTRNKKDVVATNKPKVSAVPPIALFAIGAAMQNGADKYGLFNWRESEVKATTFFDAIHRHLAAWYSGEDYADDSKVHHLAHVMAGCAIILDAINSAVFVDDRSHTTLMDEGIFKNGNK